MSPLPPRVPARRADFVKTIGAAISSCAGVGGAASICAAHGSNQVALLIFGSMQVWALCELICRWRMKWHYMRLYESVVRKAAEHPDDANLRTLLIDLASTHLDDLGDRIPVRADLKKLSMLVANSLGGIRWATRRYPSSLSRAPQACPVDRHAGALAGRDHLPITSVVQNRTN